MCNLSRSPGKYAAVFALAATFLCTLLPTETEAAYRSPKVPMDIYEWIQASPRTSYYFNKQYICYQTNADGTVDVNLLRVPILRTYDQVQVEDIIAKRRWHQQQWENLSEMLAAEANNVTIDCEKRTVTIRDSILLTDTFAHLINEPAERVIELDKLSEKSLERRFFESILQYAYDNPEKLIANTKGTLTEADQKKLTKARKAETKRQKAKEKAKKRQAKQADTTEEEAE